MIVSIALVIVIALILQDALLIGLLRFNFKSYTTQPKADFSWPTVSIIIPFRNEESNVARVLASLEHLVYPIERLQIILGDDGSEDRTGELLQSWASKFVHVDFFSLNKPVEFSGNGKAWALQQLCEHATGEYLLFTDADCELPVDWASSMVNASLSTNAAMVTGVTQVEGSSTFAIMQSLDWYLNLGMVKVLSDLGTNITSMGNNMLVTKAYYKLVGGFEQTYHSLTEDFEMAKCVARAKGKHIHLVSAGNLITTQLISSFLELLQQRKRWMHGAMALPLYWKVLLGLQVLFFPSIILLTILSFWKGIGLWLLKLVTQSLFLIYFSSKTAQLIKIRHLFLFEIYYLCTAWCTIVYYFWPGKTRWKGRSYN